jgi:hypothetical protein
MSGIFAAQLTAVATLALAVLALATAIVAFLAWQKQSGEVRDQAKMLQVQSDRLAEDRKVNAEQIRVLSLQADELQLAAAHREREALEQRQAQAVRVYIWLVGEEIEDGMVVHVRNTSDQPIYEVALQGTPGGGARRWREPLMPGKEVSESYAWPEELTTIGVPIPTLTFRDRAGVRWQVWSDGRLEELAERPKSANSSRVQTSPQSVR